MSNAEPAQRHAPSGSSAAAKALAIASLLLPARRRIADGDDGLARARERRGTARAVPARAR